VGYREIVEDGVKMRAGERDDRRKSVLTAKARQEDMRRIMVQQGVGNIFR
jgi:hypothetical protein